MSLYCDEDTLRELEKKHRDAKLPLNPWLKIIRAATRGTGLRLSAEEVRQLDQDDAIAAAGLNIAADDLGEDPFRE